TPVPARPWLLPPAPLPRSAAPQGAPAPSADRPLRSGRLSMPSNARASARVRVSRPSGWSFVRGPSPNRTSWIRQSGDGAPQPFFQAILRLHPAPDVYSMRTLILTEPYVFAKRLWLGPM